MPEGQLNQRQAPGWDSSLKSEQDVLRRSNPLRSMIRLENNLLRASTSSAVKPGLELVYHHADATASSNHRPGQLLTIVVGHFGHQLDESDPFTEEVHRLNTNFAETVWSRVEKTIWNEGLRLERMP